MRILLIVLFCTLLLACGGGSSGDNESPPDNNPAPSPIPSPSVSPTPSITPEPTPSPAPVLTEAAAARFLGLAGLSASEAEIDSVETMGKAGWIDSQMAMLPNYHLPLVQAFFARHQEEIESGEGEINRVNLHRHIWWDNYFREQDVLRKRVAFALSEIFVVSDRVESLYERPDGMAAYYDILLEHAFGFYEDLLFDVTTSPMMGIYLSHINNRKADSTLGLFPDENYAREVMQLFSIGLYELHPDGSQKLDEDGKPTPTYTNANITEMAKVFTGLSWGGDNDAFGETVGDATASMRMFEAHHDTGSKQLLNGLVLPAGQAGIQDVRDAVAMLANHDNTGPFIATRLIQRLVTSNPSPEYIERVADVFADNGSGQRGDLGAVVRAILLDPEADTNSNQFGKLREPVLRYIHALRTIGLRNENNRFYDSGYFVQAFTQQHPLSSPSVLNFLSPNYSPNGEIKDADLLAPEFQIATDTTLIGVTNLSFIVAVSPNVMSSLSAYGEVELDLDDEFVLAEDPQALVDYLDLTLAYGSLSEATKTLILDEITPVDNAEYRTRMAILLILISPEFAITN